MKLSIVIFCLIFCYLSKIAEIQGNECPTPAAEKRGGENPTVQGYVEGKIDEGFAKVSLEN